MNNSFNYSGLVDCQLDASDEAAPFGHTEILRSEEEMLEGEFVMQAFRLQLDTKG